MITGDSDAALATAFSSPEVSSIILTQSAYQNAAQLESSREMTIDLQGNTMTMAGPEWVGDGDSTNGLRFMKGSKVVIKNGTIKVISPECAILVQNFSDELILDNVKLQGKAATQYILSNNYGHVILRNSTTIKSSSGHIALDAHYGLSEEYDGGVTVEIEDSSVVVTGPVEFTKDARITDESQFLEKAHFIVPADYEGITPPEGFEFRVLESDPSKKELRPVEVTTSETESPEIVETPAE